MNPYSFHDELPAGYREEFETSLFHLPGHLALQSPRECESFFILSEASRVTSGVIHFFIEQDFAFSPGKAPFGSYLFSEQLPPEVLFNFIAFTEGRLKQKGVKGLRIKNAPTGYQDHQQGLLQTLLVNSGYAVENAEVSAILSVSEEKFSQKIDAWEQRKLKQSLKAGLGSRIMKGEELEEVYHFIHRCRSEKGYSLSMSLDEVQRVLQAFPDRFVLVGIFDQDKMVAASLAIRVTKRILYNFYSDHHKEYDKLSPVVLLMESLYQFCQQHEMTLLDLGTSALDNKPNFPLLDFKLRLGAVPSTKFTFVKNL